MKQPDPKLCECGCGQPAPIARKTNRARGHVKGQAVRFLPGHFGGGPAINDPPPNPSGLCMCGCGARTAIAKGGKRSREQVAGEYVRYLPGHNVRGSRRSAETRRKTSQTLIAIKHAIRDDAGSKALHMWLNRHYPKTGVCEQCGAEGKTDYAFLCHPKRHTRNRDDYRELCKSCHWRFDEPVVSRIKGRSAGSA